ncbi:MAG: hypothetical protein L6V35_04530 [Alistipes putredinis]|nr:MAG: hypothetical protein L6V35_04530 [Alistipes putredinis]
MVRSATIRRRCNDSLRLFRQYTTKISRGCDSASQSSAAQRAIARLFPARLICYCIGFTGGTLPCTAQSIACRDCSIEAYIASQNAVEQTNRLSGRSMQYLKNELHRKYGTDHPKPIFRSDDLYFHAQEVLNEYPIVLSTTFSARSSLSPKTIYDYVIMDEASQVSVETGALALSVARNAVIVGDSMQLPNVVTPEALLKLDEISRQFVISQSYDCARNSFSGNCLPYNSPTFRKLC